MEPLRKEECWLMYRPIPENNLVLGVVYPQAEVMADVFALVSATERVAGGDLNELLPVGSRTLEIQELSRDFNQMITNLKVYLENLRETTAAKERIESELAVASRIQEGMLPRTFPPFPEREEFKIFAAMDPAREVGGDFYDFFFIDETHLCFLIGGMPDSEYSMVSFSLEPGDQIVLNTDDITLLVLLFRGVTSGRPRAAYRVSTGKISGPWNHLDRVPATPSAR